MRDRKFSATATADGYDYEGPATATIIGDGDDKEGRPPTP